jgi:hypothetical protein
MADCVLTEFFFQLHVTLEYSYLLVDPIVVGRRPLSEFLVLEPELDLAICALDRVTAVADVSTVSKIDVH